MRKSAILALILWAAAAAAASATDFMYSYRNIKGTDRAYYINVCRLKCGKLSTTGRLKIDDVKTFYAYIGSAGDNAVISRYGDRSAELLNVKTLKLTPIAPGFLRGIYVSPTEMVYLATADDQSAPPTAGVLKRYVFAQGKSEVVSPEIVIQQIPFPAGYDRSKAIESFWGVFRADGKQVLGKTDIPAGKFTRIAEVDEQILGADVSKDGRLLLIGTRGAPGMGTASGSSMTAKIEVIDTATGNTVRVVQGLHQQVPENPGIAARFSAAFADSTHVLYPETITERRGQISYQRLMELDLETGATAEVATIKDKDRLVNAIPMRSADGYINWAEYQIKPGTRKAEPQDRCRNHIFRLSNDGELMVGDKLIGYSNRGVRAWDKDGVVAFIGRLAKKGSPGLFIYAPGMEKAVRVNPESTGVQTFGFLD